MGTALILAACGPTAGGQSGSEFIDGSPEYREDLNEACPCERFAGVVPLEAEVLSWTSSVLSIEVKGTPIESLRQRAPIPGTRLVGIYLGELPCSRGIYVPMRGDRVLAYFFRAPEPVLLCCDAVRCSDECETKYPDDLEAVDACTGECQMLADTHCKAQRAGAEIAGYFELAPFDGESAELARAGETSLRVAASDLSLVHGGGKACRTEIPDVRDALAHEDARNEAGPWQRSCER